MIKPKDFIKEMEKHWTERLGNVSSKALRKVWYQQAEVYGYYAIGDSHRDEWTVLQPPTGSGKTQGTIVYCSMLSRLTGDLHPGVLIVTRLKADANQIAEKINELSGNMKEAVAYHSDTKDKLNITHLRKYPVLVITHRAYELALDLLGQGGSIQQTWPYFYDWKISTRRLVVIDEALDIVEHSQAELRGLRLTVATLSQSIRSRFPEEVQCINEVIDVLDTYEKKTKKNTIKEHKILGDLIKNKKVLCFTGLRQAMRKEIRYDHLLGKSDNLEQQTQRETHDLRIRDLVNIIKSWVYYAHVNRQPTLNTARLLVPDHIQGAVVLDATASRNVLYELFPPARVRRPPKGSRNYKNVTLHISRGHKLGRGSMKDNSKQLSRELIAELNERLEENRKVFICTHKKVDAVLTSYEPKFNLKIGHWGAIDGSNDYRDCDTAVIFGIPYRPNIWAANVFMALQGEQSTEWLQQSDKRSWKKHEDIRRSLNNGQIVTSIIQAINRVKCRKVIDADGNCPNTDIYLMLPNDGIAEEILDGIKKEMPNIRTKEWTYSSAKSRVKRSNHELAFIKFITNMNRGRQAVSIIKKNLGISSTTFKALINKMNNKKSALYKAMTIVGAQYESNQEGGRGNRAYIYKC